MRDGGQSEERGPFYISVDLGGSSVRVALGSLGGGVTAEAARSIDRRVEAGRVLDFIADAVSGFVAKGATPACAVLAFPGLLGDGGEVSSAPNLSPSWCGLRPSREIAERILLPVAAANDARIATLGEWRFGGSLSADQRSTATMIYLGLGTGVGGGLVVRGRVHGGATGAAGEFGHLVVDANGPKCACGSRGCVEALAGGASLVQGARQLLLDGRTPRLRELLDHGDENPVIDGELIGLAAEAGDRPLVDLLERAARALGALAANLIHVVSPDVIVVGGGLSHLGDRLFIPLWQEVRRRVRMVPLEGLRIEPSQLGDRAGLLGGLVLAAGSSNFDVAVHRAAPGEGDGS